MVAAFGTATVNALAWWMRRYNGVIVSSLHLLSQVLIMLGICAFYIGINAHNHTAADYATYAALSRILWLFVIFANAMMAAGVIFGKRGQKDGR